MLYGAGICPKLFSPLFVPFSLEHSWLFSVSPRAHFTSRVSRTGQFHETVSVSYAFHAILQRLTRSLPKTNFFVIPPFSRISGGSIRDIKVSRELKSFVFLRIGYSKCSRIYKSITKLEPTKIHEQINKVSEDELGMIQLLGFVLGGLAGFLLIFAQ